MTEPTEPKPKKKRPAPGTGPGRGNYPRKSRKGVAITPSKGGRTKRFPTVWMTPDEHADFQRVLESKGLTPTGWIELHLKADAANLTEDSKEV